MGLIKSRNGCSGNGLEEKYKERLVELTFPGAPLPLTNEKINELKSYFKNKPCEVSSVVYNSEILKNDGLNQFVCAAFETGDPLAYQLSSACFGSTKDNFLPSCDVSGKIEKIEGLKEYTQHLRKLFGNPDGTYWYASYRDQNAVIATAVYGITLSEKLNNESKAMSRFSIQGIWEQEEFQKYVQLRKNAQKGLENYYVHTKLLSLDEAKKLAQYQVNNLVSIYIDSHTGSHGFWNLTDVDDFLKNDILPENVDSSYLYNDSPNLGNVETKEKAKPVILAHFLRFAIVSNYTKKDIQRIILAGANLNILQDEYDTPLMNAVKRADILKLLIDNGANVNLQNHFGKTALMYAIQYDNLEAVKILVEHKADINLATYKLEDIQGYSEQQLSAGQRTPLMYAAWHASDDIVKYLLSKGANPEAKDTNGHDYEFYLTINDYKKK